MATMGVQADLVNTADGSELWGSHYERKVSEITQVQSDITRDVSTSCKFIERSTPAKGR